MMLKIHLTLLLCIFWSIYVNGKYQEQDAPDYLKRINKEYLKEFHKLQLIRWASAANTTDDASDKKDTAEKEFDKFKKKIWLKTIKFPWQNFQDEDIRRQFKKYSVIGNAALPEDKYEKLQKLIDNMGSINDETTICDYNNPEKCDLGYYDIQDILKNSRDVKELEYVFTEWRRQVGQKVRPLFIEYVALSNEAAKLNNFKDASEYWLDEFETETAQFKNEIDNLWKQMRPFYLQMYAYIRGRLRKVYGEEVVPKCGPIPAYLQGDLENASWFSLFDLIAPFPEIDGRKEDMDPYMVEQKYTAKKIYQLADDYWTKLNLTSMPDTFWKNSIIEQPEDREIDCSPTSWDFYDAKDYRVIQCTSINQYDLYEANYLVSLVEEYIQRSHQPYIYRRAANSGLDGAIGSAIYRSIFIPKYRHLVGLLPNPPTKYESELKGLFFLATTEMAVISSNYLTDVWRWKVFEGEIKEDQYNSEWWKLKYEIQRIKAPGQVSEEDFDPGAMDAVATDVPLIPDVTNQVFLFQFLATFCEMTNQYNPKNPQQKPLHKCLLYNNPEVGNLAGKMLKLGSSRPWREALEIVTGKKTLDATPLINYFEPLISWLKKDNEKNSECVEWE